MNNDLRIERKFLAHTDTLDNFISIIKEHPLLFKEAYQARFVNNIYFDTGDLKLYSMSVEGEKNRIKIRIRWYGYIHQIIKNPILELKTKNGLMGRKSKYALNQINFEHLNNLTPLKHFLFGVKINRNTKSHLSDMKISLINRYKRRYYQSLDGHVRVTIDSDLTYSKHINPDKNIFGNSLKSNDLVIEVKYAKENENIVQDFTGRLPVRLTKNSKYLKGIEAIHI